MPAWAPVHVSYGSNNRTQMLRIPEGGRIENRGCDGAANPYLAYTAALGAGLDGIRNEIDPGPPLDVDMFELSEAELAGA